VRTLSVSVTWWRLPKAQRFITGRTRADIDRDEQLRFALVRAVEIIGEAARCTAAAPR